MSRRVQNKLTDPEHLEAAALHQAHVSVPVGVCVCVCPLKGEPLGQTSSPAAHLRASGPDLIRFLMEIHELVSV